MLLSTYNLSTIMLYLFVNSILFFSFIYLTSAIEFNELRNWYNYIKNPATECSKIESDLSFKKSVPILKITHCDSTDAIVNYDFKVSNTKIFTKCCKIIS